MNQAIKDQINPFFLFSSAFILVLLTSGCIRNKTQEKFGPAGELCAGVNIHFTTGHEKDLDMIAAAGIRFIRMDFVWHDIEKEKGKYDWSAYDELTDNLKKRGLRALYILDYSNPLYEPEVESKDPLTGESQKGIAAPCNPESVEAFSKWAAAAAERYMNNDIVWEIWNEPNITFWRPAPDIDDYITLARSVCKAVRDADPEAIIIGPATSQIPFPFIDTFLMSGILEHIDGVSVHPYRDYAKSPETAGEDYNRIREMILKNMPEGKNPVPVISSEWGYASATKGVSLGTQAAFVVRMQLANLLYGVPLSIWYDWKNDGTQPGNFEHNCGIVTYDLVPKPAYIAMKTMNEQLSGFKLVRRMETENLNDFILIFQDSNNNQKYVAWSADSSHYTHINIPVNQQSGIAAADWDGEKMEIQSDEGKVSLTLGPLPVYLTNQ